MILFLYVILFYGFKKYIVKLQLQRKREPYKKNFQFSLDRSPLF